MKPSRAAPCIATALSLVIPAALSAQLRISLPGIGDPTVRGSVGPWSVSAGVGRRGVDVRVGGRRLPTSAGRRTPAPRDPDAGRTTTGRTTSSAAASARATRVLSTADDYVGTPYVWGGETPRGFDCSGFVQYVFRRHGVVLPRTSRQQVRVGHRVSPTRAALRPGDLMMFASNGTRVDHVAIYVGDDRIIHASRSGGGVRYDDLTSRRGRWYVKHHVASRRVVGDGQRLVAPLTGWLALRLVEDQPTIP